MRKNNYLSKKNILDQYIPMSNEQNIYCFDDLQCKNKKCKKIHPERKRLNICQFDIFFIPNKDRGCHFEDCTFHHPRRIQYEKKKESDFDDLIYSVVDFVLKDEDSDFNTQSDLRKLYQNLYSYQELENDFVIKFKNVENILYQSQQLYSNAILQTKADYNQFMNNFMSITSQTKQKCERFIDAIVMITIAYPHCLEECKVISQQMIQIYHSIFEMNQFVIQEYNSSIHLYPDFEQNSYHSQQMIPMY